MTGWSWLVFSFYFFSSLYYLIIFLCSKPCRRLILIFQTQQKAIDFTVRYDIADLFFKCWFYLGWMLVIWCFAEGYSEWHQRMRVSSTWYTIWWFVLLFEFIICVSSCIFLEDLCPLTPQYVEECGFCSWMNFLVSSLYGLCFLLNWNPFTFPYMLQRLCFLWSVVFD